MTMQRQALTFRKDRSTWEAMNMHKMSADVFHKDLEQWFNQYLQPDVSWKDILTYLEFEDPEYFEAFRVPQAADGSIAVGRRGKAVTEFYLLHQWENSHDAGIFKKEPHIHQAPDIRAMPTARYPQRPKWTNAYLQEQVDDMYAIASKYNDLQDKRGCLWAKRNS